MGRNPFAVVPFHDKLFRQKAEKGAYSMPKFKNIKGKKEKLDQAKNNQFVKLAREIYVQARRGGPNPEANFGLKTAIANARAINMPVDNIDRAIKRATGENDGADYEEIIYEGYGPGGVAIMVKCLTDNRNRTAADVRAVFNKRGGNMGESGCVSYMFNEKGLFIIDREVFDELDEDTMMMQALEAGAEDVAAYDDSFEITSAVADFEQVKTTLEADGLQFASAEIRWLPSTMSQVDADTADKLQKMMDSFDDNDDVQDVYHNWEE
jgi:YebC/PmpR family DNA-binding regulatory protein